MPLNPARPADPIGWPLLPVPDSDGCLTWPDLESSVRQTIRALLITRHGEHLLHPQLGGSLQDFIHQPNTILNRRAMTDRIVQTLRDYEPRIIVNNVSVEAAGAHEERVDVTIDYQLRLSGMPSALALSLTLVTGG